MAPTFQHAPVAGFVERVRGGGAPGAAFVDGRIAQEVLAAVVTSVDGHRWVSA